MAQKTDAELLAQKQIIKTETVANANTATRIGQMHEDSIESKINNLDTYTKSFPKVDITGTTAYTGTLSPAITAYGNGMKVHVKAKGTSTGGVTLDLNTVGAKQVWINPTTQAGAGDLIDEQEYILSYDSALNAGAGVFLMIAGGGANILAWTDTAAGIVEKSTNTEANNIVVRAAAGGSDGSNSELRTPSEVGLVQVLMSFLAGAWTWTLKQIFSSAPRFSSTTASQFLKVDSNKDLVSVAAATQAEMLTATDDTKVVTPRAVEDKESDKLTTVSNSATGSTAVNFGLKRRFKGLYNTTLTGNSTVTFTDATNLEFGEIVIPITGSVTITWPSSVVMEESNPRWTNGTKVLAVIGGTASPFVFSLSRIANTPLYELRASYRIYTS